MYKMMLLHLSVNYCVVYYSSVISNEHENEHRRSKKIWMKSSFDPDFITTFLTVNFVINVLNDEKLCIYLIEENLKTYDEVMQ